MSTLHTDLMKSVLIIEPANSQAKIELMFVEREVDVNVIFREERGGAVCNPWLHAEETSELSPNRLAILEGCRVLHRRFAALVGSCHTPRAERVAILFEYLRRCMSVVPLSL